ncbi:putative peptide transporter permease subunit: membrane component of ABC superfamily [Nitrospina gracilis 3/211]|uniref:Oligopeptide transport system permease protein OppC n=1 Tax=Nitrospina gracilis (strain 3/211) TaxID=1266370 RepID=M1Z1G5_NITG3|nr:MULTISPECIES: ABC transporter permease [Nitrospina]MCF8724650.1 oligopeptide transport system permease protein [Nitrospina sp. Nb-3]CCQ91832.1 putative peptide transporter permease subunit: membrane component of ABC superfamily [Nitrospina gracilis 3/211]
MRAMWSRFSLAAKLSACFLAAIALAALFAPWLTPFSFEEQDTLNALAAPDATHWMGTDRLGRDLFSRMLYGARVSLFLGVGTTLIALVIGTVYGAISGYIGGRIDNFLMRVVDVIFALPDLLLIILIMVVLGRGLTSIFLALTMVSWVTVARLVRGEVLRIKEFTFVEAARALGAGHRRILFSEIVPNLWGVLIVTMTFRIPVAILAESTLSFIGLGIAPPFSSWGTLANDGWTAIKFYPHLIVFPSLAIFLTILAFNFLGEGLRDHFDPRKSSLEIN